MPPYTPTMKECLNPPREHIDQAKRRLSLPDRDPAVREIAASLDQFYPTNHPPVYSSNVYSNNAARVKNARDAVQAIHLNNVFPEMKITYWGMYPNDLGHMDFPGCFRCHDGDHVSTEGRSIENDCSTCHDLLAVDEKNLKILSGLGYNAGAPEGLE